jgi:hypothetical protein
LLDLSGFRQCLIGDRDGIYDPGSANGRLLLGLKGTISEVELHTLRGRLTAGLLNKAKRGELALLLPAGLERDTNGIVHKDPNQEVQDRVSLIFTTFLDLGSAGKVMRRFRNHALTLPRRDRFGDVVWRAPTAGMLTAILKNPAYACAFVYGRTRSCHSTYANGKLMTERCPMSEWKIVVKDRYPVYLDWERFEQVQAMLRDNHAENQRNQTRGIPRDGAAVLQGIVWCGQCGHKMAVQYKNANSYVCNYLLRSQGGQLCQHLPADLIDARVGEAFLAAIGPAELETWAGVNHARQQTRDAANRAEAQQVERLRYQALLAERQYNRVDPDNRLIAAELERRWETALRELRQAEDALARRQVEACKPEALSAEEQNDFLALGARLPEIWQRPQVNRESKKALLRSLIDKVILHRVMRDRITIRVVWRGGEISLLHQVKICLGDVARLPNPPYRHLPGDMVVEASGAGSRTLPLIPIGLCCFAAGKISEHQQQQVRSRPAAWLHHTCCVYASAGRGRRRPSTGSGGTASAAARRPRPWGPRRALSPSICRKPGLFSIRRTQSQPGLPC